MGKMEIFAVMPVATWLATELCGKFLFPKLDKKVLANVVGIAVAIGARIYFKDEVGNLETLIAAALNGTVTGVWHDKQIEPMMILSKKEIAGEEKK